MIHYNKLLTCKEIKKSRLIKINHNCQRMFGYSLKTTKTNHSVFTVCRLKQDPNSSKNLWINSSIKTWNQAKDRISTSFIRLNKSKIGCRYSSNKFNIRTFKQTFKSFIILFQITRSNPSHVPPRACMVILRQCYRWISVQIVKIWHRAQEMRLWDFGTFTPKPHWNK